MGIEVMRCACAHGHAHLHVEWFIGEAILDAWDDGSTLHLVVCNESPLLMADDRDEETPEVHMSRELVAALLPYLHQFVETGRIDGAT